MEDMVHRIKELGIKSVYVTPTSVNDDALYIVGELNSRVKLKLES
jgi:hypothetical protein